MNSPVFLLIYIGLIWFTWIYINSWGYLWMFVSVCWYIRIHMNICGFMQLYGDLHGFTFIWIFLFRCMYMNMSLCELTWTYVVSCRFHVDLDGFVWIYEYLCWFRWINMGLWIFKCIYKGSWSFLCISAVFSIFTWFYMDYHGLPVFM